MGTSIGSCIFVELSYRNPAVRYDRYSSSLTRATVGGQYTSESEPVLLQSGDGEKSIGFQADSYIRKRIIVCGEMRCIEMDV